MSDADRATCPQCGAPISFDDAAGLCPRCRVSDTQGGQSEDLPVAPSSPDGASGKRKLTLGSAVAAVGAIVLTRMPRTPDDES